MKGDFLSHNNRAVIVAFGVVSVLDKLVNAVPVNR